MTKRKFRIMHLNEDTNEYEELQLESLIDNIVDEKGTKLTTILENIENNVETQVTSNIASGSAKFSGYSSKTKVNIPSSFNNNGTSYSVSITPITSSPGSVGEYSIIRSSSYFEVYNTGNSGTSFTWTIVKY